MNDIIPECLEQKSPKGDVDAGTDNDRQRGNDLSHAFILSFLELFVNSNADEPCS